jgi:two-component system chemotaxis response regulator CheB
MIVDDSVVVRGLIARWLNAVPEIAVVSSQPNGAAALRELDRARPDVVLLDIEMPVMDGITALPLMLAKRKDLVVIMASGLTQRNAEISLRALALGARDYIPKPDANHVITTSVAFRRDLIEKVTVLGAAARGRHVIARLGQSAEIFADSVQFPRAIALRPFSAAMPRALAVGSSTGGPQALYALFRTVGPAMAGIPVLVAQHMPPNFTAVLADQLGKDSGRPAAEGRHGEILKPGRIYVAPGGKHMLIEAPGGLPMIAISDQPPVNFCKPAVDPLFESVARLFGAASLAVVLTGMGTDGARGSAKIADAGGSVIAQDAATSVVWGMPGTAAHLGVCAAVLPLDEIGRTVAAMLSGEP